MSGAPSTSCTHVNATAHDIDMRLRAYRFKWTNTQAKHDRTLARANLAIHLNCRTFTLLHETFPPLHRTTNYIQGPPGHQQYHTPYPTTYLRGADVTLTRLEYATAAFDNAIDKYALRDDCIWAGFPGCRNGCCPEILPCTNPVADDTQPLCHVHSTTLKLDLRAAADKIQFAAWDLSLVATMLDVFFEHNKFTVPVALGPTIEESRCSICLEDFAELAESSKEIQKAVRLVSCKHVFCKGCIETWFYSADAFGTSPRTCPLCRAEVVCAPQSVAAVEGYEWSLEQDGDVVEGSGEGGRATKRRNAEADSEAGTTE